MSDRLNSEENADSIPVLDFDSIATKVEISDSVKLSSPTEKKFNIQQSQETTRSILAGFLMLLLGASIFGIGVYIWNIKDIKDSSTEALKNSRELITLIWTSQVTLTSGALAYYFASNKS